jgi:hypothetical protein
MKYKIQWNIKINVKVHCLFKAEWPSWSCSHGSCICNYQCNQCISSLKLWVRNPLRRDVLDTTLCDNVYQWLAAGVLFSPGTRVSSTNKTDLHHITEILLKVALNTITLTKVNYHYKISLQVTDRSKWSHDLW